MLGLACSYITVFETTAHWIFMHFHLWWILWFYSPVCIKAPCTVRGPAVVCACGIYHKLPDFRFHTAAGGKLIGAQLRSRLTKRTAVQGRTSSRASLIGSDWLRLLLTPFLPLVLTWQNSCWHTFHNSFACPAVQLVPVQMNYHATTSHTTQTAPHGWGVWLCNIGAKTLILQKELVSFWRQELMQPFDSGFTRKPVPL